MIEWDRFVDKGAVQPDRFARKIDTQLAPPLSTWSTRSTTTRTLADPTSRRCSSALATRNLLRGYHLALPTGPGRRRGARGDRR